MTREGVIRTRKLNFLVLGIICLILPLLGLYMAGNSLSPFLQFPPETRQVDYPPLSNTAFFGLLVVAILLAGAWVFGVDRPGNADSLDSQTRTVKSLFPWWGCAGALWLSGAWLLAWNRFEWFRPWQAYTFTLLWLGYIVIVNACIKQRSGKCPLLDEPGPFLVLFPVSAVFWWIFEYFNRLVRNWVYLGVVQFSTIEYIIHATIAFSTVLPAVTSTKRLLETIPSFKRLSDTGPSLRIPHARFIAFIALASVIVTFSLIGIFPHFLFPLLWAGPVIVWLAINEITRTPVDLGGVSRGRGAYVVGWATAALCCGFFWEMWNVNSLAKWIYQVPYFQGYRLFEMPLAGYVGYLPFGLECAIVVDATYGACSRRRPVE